MTIRLQKQASFATVLDEISLPMIATTTNRCWNGIDLLRRRDSLHLAASRIE